ncbi:hypothetical protein [Enterococcus gallinarum]|uniref:hypothetical protein n=1 Tax=Enterococcus gallinarum TaxID=1353 RepID=UPI00214C2F05|nr:hypothetical protein [Enterococcus gallinarum]MCR1930894.1 hypothetical protein [Enterococcus gallinarum]
MKKTLILGLAIATLGMTILQPLSSVVAYADESSNTISEGNQLEAQTIYEDEDGNIFTDSEVIVQNGETNPLIQNRSMSAKPISIGILWTYTTKADGTKLRNTFRKAATAEGIAGITAVVTTAGLATGIIAPMLGAFAGIGAWAFHSRFTEGANLINEHPKSGKIYMYLDHVTYSK